MGIIIPCLFLDLKQETLADEYLVENFWENPVWVIN